MDNYVLELSEFMYIHLQARKMTVCVDNSNHCFKIIPHKFEQLEIPVDEIHIGNFKDIKLRYQSNHYLSLRSRNLKTKIRTKLKC